MSAPFAPSCPVPAYANDRIEMAHGGGGMMTRRLIEEVFRPAFATGPQDFTHDGMVLETGGGGLAFTTDSYVVQPLFFPGGDIGTLAINGTVNDLAMCGAEPLVLSVGFILEEGLAMADLHRVVTSMKHAAAAAGVRIVTGDTKVVEHGRCDGLYLNTSGIGRVMSKHPIGPLQVRPGDRVILSGDIGRHGIAVMAEREHLGFQTEIRSDCAPLSAPVRALIKVGVELHCLRDLTRGGLATALIEIAEVAKVEIKLAGLAIAVSDPVRGACEILGLDPFYVANEGRFVAIVPEQAAGEALTILRRFDPLAAIIGTVTGNVEEGGVFLETLGGMRPLDLLSGEQMPRIC